MARPALWGLAGLAVLHTGLWFWGEARLRRDVAEWMAAQRQKGWIIEAAATEQSGWPLAVGLALHGVHMVPAGAQLQLAIRSDLMILRIGLLRPTGLLVRAEGCQTVDAAGMPPLQVGAGRLQAFVPFTGADRTISLHGEALRARSGAGNMLAIGLLAAKLLLPAAPREWSLAAEARDIVLPPLAPAAFPETLTDATLAATIHGRLSGPGPLPARLALWRDRGGLVQLGRAALHAPGMELEASATLSLDQALQPVGVGTVRITGWDGLAATLRRAGVFDARSAAMAAAFLDLLAEAPPGEGPSVVALPVTLQDHILAIGRVPVLRLSSIPWRRE